MRSSVLLATPSVLVTVAVVAVSAQTARDQLKAYTESAPAQGKAEAPKGATPAAQG